MNIARARLRHILQWSLIAVVCSMVVGLIFYQGAVLNPHYHTFIFVADAAYGALFFFTLRFAGRRNALILLALLYVLDMGPFTHAFQYGYTLTYSIFFCITPLAVYVYYTSIFGSDRVKSMWHPFIVGALCAACTILARLIIVAIGMQHWHRSWLEFPRAFFPEDWMAFLMGVGMGTGFVLSEIPHLRKFVNLHA